MNNEACGEGTSQSSSCGEYQELNDADNEIKCSSVSDLMAFNEAYQDSLQSVIDLVEKAIEENKQKQEALRYEIRNCNSHESSKRVLPIQPFLPPYFKDKFGMGPPMNEEAKLKKQLNWYNPLMREPKAWSNEEIKTLRKAIFDEMIENQLNKNYTNREMLRIRLKNINSSTTPAEIESIKLEIENNDRVIEFWKNQPLEEVVTANADYNKLSWNNISNTRFYGQRTAEEIYSKWMNELSPKWNKNEWTKDEIEKLIKLRDDESFISWQILSIQLGTRRTPFQCFEKYTLEKKHVSQKWTHEDDQKLLTLTKLFTINNQIQWDKVSQCMPGRKISQMKVRYMSTLSENIKHGRWSETEDRLLTNAIDQYGAKDWNKICYFVPGRSGTQCRERWYVLGVKSEEYDSVRFTPEEDEKLLQAIKKYGKGSWSKCATLFPNKSAKKLRYRYIQLISYKLKETILYENVKKNVNWPEVEKFLQRSFNTDNTNSAEMRNLLQNFDLSEKDLSYIISRWKNNKNNIFVDPRIGPSTTKTNVRPMKKNIEVTVQTEFNNSVPEEERKMCLVEALCQAIRRHDHHEWSASFWINFRKNINASIKKFINFILNKRGELVINSIRSGEPIPAKTTLPPSTTTQFALEYFLRTKNHLQTLASRYFYPINVGLNDRTEYNEKISSAESVAEHSRLNISLSEDLLRSTEYVQFQARMRTLFLEPYRLIIATETEDEEHERMKRDVDFLAREEEQEEIEPTEEFKYYDSGDIPPIISQLKMEGIKVDIADLLELSYKFGDEKSRKRKIGVD